MKTRNTEQSLTITGNKVVSYETHVATIKDNQLLIYGWYSSTTSKHLNQLAQRLNLTKVELKRSDNPDLPKESDIVKATANFAAMAAFFAPTQEEANDTKARILKAGLTQQGLIMPSDWDQLSEEEKETRLNKVIEIAQS